MIFDDRYREDPFLIPIAVPSLSGHSAITTVMLPRSQQQVSVEGLQVTLHLVMLVTCAIFLLGRISALIWVNVVSTRWRS